MSKAVSNESLSNEALSKAAVSKAGVRKATGPSAVECNLVVLHGAVRAVPVVKELASGDVLVSFDLRVPGPDGKGAAVPVSWIGSAERAPAVVADEAVVVVGQVSRRFFQTQTGLASRVDVRANQIVTGTMTRRRKAIVAAQLLLS